MDHSQWSSSSYDHGNEVSRRYQIMFLILGKTEFILAGSGGIIILLSKCSERKILKGNSAMFIEGGIGAARDTSRYMHDLLVPVCQNLWCIHAFLSQFDLHFIMFGHLTPGFELLQNLFWAAT